MKENVGLVAFLLFGCAIIAMFLGLRSPAIEDAQTPCTPIPMPTGEQYYPTEFTLPPPSSVMVGQPVRIEFTGGILVAATGQQCGEEFHVLLPNQTTAEATIREVQVKLNQQVIHTQSYAYHCILEFYIPSYLAGGRYDWELSGVWDTSRFPVYAQPLLLT